MIVCTFFVHGEVTNKMGFWCEIVGFRHGDLGHDGVLGYLLKR
jgi:hypothetical protein